MVRGIQSGGFSPSRLREKFPGALQSWLAHLERRIAITNMACGRILPVASACPDNDKEVTRMLIAGYACMALAGCCAAFTMALASGCGCGHHEGRD